MVLNTGALCELESAAQALSGHLREPQVAAA
jgi:hypothetical protein